MKNVLWILVAGLTSSGLVACSDDATGGDKPEPTADMRMLSDAGPDMGMPLPQGSRELQVVGDLNVLVELGGTAQFQVRYIDNNMAPVPNGQITFRIYNERGQDVTAEGAEGTLLRSQRAVTNAQGIATAGIVAGNNEVVLKVEASANGASSVRWNVTVGAAGSGTLAVTVAYDPAQGRYGYNQLSEARADIFDGQTCDVLFGSATNLIGAYLALPPISPFNEVDNTTNSGSLDADSTFTVAATLVNQQGNVIAFGCQEDVTIVGGDVTMITITTADLPLDYKGRFTAVNRFDLTGVLRESEDPTLSRAGQILDVLSILGNSQGERGEAIVHLFCDLANVDEGICNLVARFDGVVDRIFEDLVPATVLNILNVVGDVVSIVNDLTVVGQIEFTGSPDMDGRLNGNDNRWQKFRFTWRNNCPEDCEREFTIGNLDVDNRPIAGVFSAGVEGDTLTIDPHSLNFRYGLVILGLAEQWLIPVLLDSQEAGPITFEEMLTMLLPCEDINGLIGARDSGLCEDLLVAALADVITDQLGTLEFSAEQFQIDGTATVLDESGNLQVDKLTGGVWNGTITVGGNPFNFKGCFNACRDGECDGDPCVIPAQ